VAFSFSVLLSALEVVRGAVRFCLNRDHRSADSIIHFAPFSLLPVAQTDFLARPCWLRPPHPVFFLNDARAREGLSTGPSFFFADSFLFRILLPAVHCSKPRIACWFGLAFLAVPLPCRRWNTLHPPCAQPCPFPHTREKVLMSEGLPIMARFGPW